MKPRDILGNLVYNGAGNTITVTPEIVNDFIRKAIGITPIPLTKEWLDRFGFGENMPGNAMWIPGNDDFLVGVQDGKFYYSEFSGSSNEPTIRHFFELKYVHSLQNAFYIFEGQELVLK